MAKRALADIYALKTHDQNLLAPAQLADYWGVGLETIRRWLRSGALKGLKLGRGWRVELTEARAFEKHL